MQNLQVEAGTWVYRATRYALGFVFVFAGGFKLLDLEAFEVLIAAYGIVPGPLINFSSRRGEDGKGNDRVVGGGFSGVGRQ